VLHESAGERTEPAPCLWLNDTNGLRASKLQHAVQGLNGDGDLRRAAVFRPRAQRISNHAFEAADGGLHQRPTLIPGSLLPAHASMLRDALEMPIALRGSSPRHLAQHGRRSRWHDDRSIGMMLGDRIVDAGLITGAIANKGGERACDQVEQRLDPRAIPDFATRQLGREDLSSLSIEADVELTSGPASFRAVFLDQPLTRPTEL
jgi:hypothetical protein